MHDDGLKGEYIKLINGDLIYYIQTRVIEQGLQPAPHMNLTRSADVVINTQTGRVIKDRFYGTETLEAHMDRRLGLKE